MAKNVKIIDRGWERIKREIEKTKRASVKIGIQSDAGKHREGDIDVVLVATVNEFGSPKRKIPQRSFIRSTADEQKEKMFGVSSVELDKIYAGRSTVINSLSKMGQMMQDRIIEKINTIKYPPNAEATQIAKGRKVGKGVKISNPLVDTGQLKQSIRWRLENA